MGSTERRTREREEIRVLILDAARELATREGYEAVTMRRIAERIEYAPAALYRHYRDKTAIFAALSASDHAALLAELRPHMEVQDPVERLRRIGRSYVEFGMANLDRYRMMFLTPVETEEGEEDEVRAGAARPGAMMPAMSRPAEWTGDDLYAFLRRTVADAVAGLRFRPELTDVDILTQAVWAGLHGIVALHAARTRSSDIAWRPVRQAAALLVESLIRGLARGRAV